MNMNFGPVLTLVATLAFAGYSQAQLLAPALAPAPAPQPDVVIKAVQNSLQFGSAIPADQAAAVNEALGTLFVLALDPSKPEVQAMSKTMDNGDVTATGMQTWVEARVKYIVENNFDLDAHAAFSAQTFAYQNPTELPDALTQPQPQPQPKQTSPFFLRRNIASVTNDDQQDPNKQEAQTVMSNIGAAIYAFGKQNNHLVVMDLPGIGQVNVTSPRTGILEIGPGLFPDMGGHKVQNIALDIFRLGTLFHEARHSDGHGHTLGFMHAICPVGHDYEGLAACDLALNGPYSVGAAVHKSLMVKCNDSATCTPVSAQLLQMIYADQADRVIGAPVGVTPSPDAKGNMDWNDAPEGTR